MQLDQTQTRGSAMTLPAALSGFVFFILMRHVVQSQSGWGVTYSPDRVCAEEGATVELTCTYRYPNSNNYNVTKSFWFIKESLDLKDNPQYANRVTYSDGNRRVRITNVRKSDSAKYKFRFITEQLNGSYTGSSGVTLTLRGEVQVKSKGGLTSDWVTLTCVSSCPVPQPASYNWYKDGKKITAATTNSHRDYYDHSYSCALKDFESFPSAPTCGYYSKCNTVTYADRTICAPLGSSVHISCTHDRYEEITSKFWFSPQHRDRWINHERPEDLSEDSQYTGRVQVSDDKRGRYTLKITDLRKSDSAEYRFKFRTKNREWGNDLHGTTLTVTDLQVQVKRIKTFQYFTEVELKCQCSCCEAEHLSYIWFKNKTEISGADKSTYQSSFSHEDKISCAVNSHEGFPSPSVYAPKPPSVSVTPSAEVEEGTEVNLSCSSDANPAASYTWYKNSGPQNLSHLQSGPLLTVSFIKSSDSGEYFCEAENELGTTRSTNISVTVKRSSSLIVNIIRVTVVIFMFTLLIPLNMWKRKKKTVNSSDEPNKPAEMMELDQLDPDYENDSAQSEEPEEQNQLNQRQV